MILSNAFCELLQNDDGMLVTPKRSKQNLPKKFLFGWMALDPPLLAKNLLIPHQDKSPFSKNLPPQNFYPPHPTKGLTLH